jgi:hypothetical protein
MYKSRKKTAMLLLTLLWGCAPKQQTDNIRINLTDSGRSLSVIGIGPDILQEITRDSVTSGWQSLVPVYRMPADTDLKDFQKAQPGKYVVKGGAILFTPDTPFAKKTVYFVRYFQYNSGHNATDYITAHKKLGQPTYTDLIFKP